MVTFILSTWISENPWAAFLQDRCTCIFTKQSSSGSSLQFLLLWSKGLFRHNHEQRRAVKVKRRNWANSLRKAERKPGKMDGDSRCARIFLIYFSSICVENSKRKMSKCTCGAPQALIVKCLLAFLCAYKRTTCICIFIRVPMADVTKSLRRSKEQHSEK